MTLRVYIDYFGMSIQLPDEKIGVHGIIVKNEKVLVLQRSDTDKYDPLGWDLAGGGIDAGEKTAEGFIREAEEEAGIKTRNIKIIGAYSIDDDSLQILVIAEAVSDEVKLSFEHSDSKWVSIEEFLKLEPVSVHLKAAQKIVKENVRVVKYEEIS